MNNATEELLAKYILLLKVRYQRRIEYYVGVTFKEVFICRYQKMIVANFRHNIIQL